MQALALRRRRPPTTSSRAAPAGASSPTTTVQAPQSPSLQPSLVPVQRASSRSQSRTVRVGAAPSISTTAPRWKKRIGRLDIGRSMVSPMVYTRFACHPALPRAPRRAAPTPRRASPSAATCSISAPTRPGATSIRRRCAFGPITGCSSKAAASSPSRPRRPARLAAARPRRPARPARLRRHPCAQPADRRHRQLRQRAARLADDAHVSGRSAPRRRGACRGRGGALPRCAARARHDLGGRLPDRPRRLGRRALRRRRGARHARHRRQGADGSQRAGRPGRRRRQRASARWKR